MLARLGLVPHQERFYDLFNRSVANTLDGAHVLAELLEQFADIPSTVDRLKDIERRGDGITREVFLALNHSYMTPFDRDDIGPLAAALDDLMDHIEAVGRRIPLYRITATTPMAGRLSRVILQQVELLNTAMPLLEDPRRTGELENLLERVHQLENEADDLLADAVSTLYEGVEHVPQLIQAVRWGELFQLLEDTTDKAERAAVVIRTIADKNA
jgi:predicted phosphate transport protein (TIGR00153 family)